MDAGATRRHPHGVKKAPLYLGEPDFDDVESAAALWVRYLADGEPSRETSEMFFMMVERPQAVRTRAEELRAA